MEIEIQELIKEDSVDSFNFFLDNENKSISNEEEFKLEKEGNEYNLTIKAPKGLENVKPYIDFLIDDDFIFNKLKLELEEGDTFNLKFKDLNINKLDLEFWGNNGLNEFNLMIDISDTVVNKIGCRNYVIAKTYCEIYNLIINNNTKKDIAQAISFFVLFTFYYYFIIMAINNYMRTIIYISSNYLSSKLIF